MSDQTLTVSALALAAAALAAPARAHVCMVQPVSRVGANCNAGSPQKVGPCGVAGRGGDVTVYRPGETITVELNETIPHPGHYRIAFNPNGDDFEDPTSRDDNTGAHPFVLADNIADDDADDAYPDNPAITQSVQVTLPNVQCENCTLQLIQVMYDKGGNGFGGNDGPSGKADNDDLYYACADIALRGAPVGPGADGGATPGDASVGATNDAGVPGDAAGGGTGGGGTMSSGAGGATSGSGAPDDNENGGGCTATTSRRHAGLFGVCLVALGLLARRRRLRG